jgi:O-antigen/teichoic acid export membrane protein
LLEVPTLATPQLLVAVERVRAAAKFVAAAALARVTLVALPLLLGRGLVGAALGLLVYAAGRLAATLLLLPRITPPGPLRIPRERIGEQLRYTAPLGLAVAAASLNAQVGKWLVAALDPASLGAFAIAATELPLVPILANATGAVLATRLVHAFHRGRAADARAYWLAATARLAVVVVPVSIALVLVAPQLVPLLFGGRYPEAVLPFQLVTLVLLHRVADYGGLLRAAGDPASLWRASMVLLGANFLFGVILTARWGMAGMAAATLTANLIAWLYVLRRISLRLGVPFRAGFPWGSYGRVLLAALAAGAATLALVRLLPDSAALQLPARLALFAAGCVLLIRGLGLARGLPPVPADAGDFAEPVPPPAPPEGVPD